MQVGRIGETGTVPDGCGYGDGPRGEVGIRGETSCCSGGGQGYSGSDAAKEKLSKKKFKYPRRNHSFSRPIPRHQKRSRYTNRY